MTSEPRKRLLLDKGNGWIAGVCAGLARYLGTDPAFLRVGAVVAGLYFPKILIAAYLVAWVICDDLPGRDSGRRR